MHQDKAEYRKGSAVFLDAVATLLHISLERLEYTNDRPQFAKPGVLEFEVLIADNGQGGESADEAVDELIAYGPGRLSYELLVPITTVFKPSMPWAHVAEQKNFWDEDWEKDLPAIAKIALVIGIVAMFLLCCLALSVRGVRRRRREELRQSLGDAGLRGRGGGGSRSRYWSGEIEVTPFQVTPSKGFTQLGEDGCASALSEQQVGSQQRSRDMFPLPEGGACSGGYGALGSAYSSVSLGAPILQCGMRSPSFGSSGRSSGGGSVRSFGGSFGGSPSLEGTPGGISGSASDEMSGNTSNGHTSDHLAGNSSDSLASPAQGSPRPSPSPIPTDMPDSIRGSIRDSMRDGELEHGNEEDNYEGEHSESSPLSSGEEHEGAPVQRQPQIRTWGGLAQWGNTGRGVGKGFQSLQMHPPVHDPGSFASRRRAVPVNY